MIAHDEFDDLLLDRYLAGECTLGERVRVRDWAAASDENARVLERLRAMRGALRETAGEADWNHDALRDRLLASVMAPSAPVSAARGGRRAAPLVARDARTDRRPAASRILRAAAVLLVAGAGAMLVARPWAPEAAGTVAEARVLSAEHGELVTLPLVDGTRVTLAAGSTLHVPAAFGDVAREVVLDGQAYFEVAPDPTRPFRVHTGRATTQVLGTKFGVRAYGDDSAVAVVVREGRVAVRRATAVPGDGAPTPAGAVVLTSGDRARIDGGTLRVERRVDVERELGWVQGRLAFDRVPLRDVLREIARWHAMPVHVEDSALASTPVSAAFGSESLREMVELLALSLDAHVQQRNGVLYLTDRP